MYNNTDPKPKRGLFASLRRRPKKGAKAEAASEAMMAAEESVESTNAEPSKAAGWRPSEESQEFAEMQEKNLGPEQKYLVKRESTDPKFKSEKESYDFYAKKAAKKLGSEKIKAKYGELESLGLKTGKYDDDMRMALNLAALEEGGAQAGLYGDDFDADDVAGEYNPGESKPNLVGADEKQMKYAKRINKKTTTGTGYRYSSSGSRNKKGGFPEKTLGKVAKGSITRRPGR